MWMTSHFMRLRSRSRRALKLSDRARMVAVAITFHRHSRAITDNHEIDSARTDRILRYYVVIAASDLPEDPLLKQ